MATGIDLLVQLIHSKSQGDWGARNKEAFEAMFGAPSGRYRKDAQATVTLRAPEMSSDTGVPFAAYIHPSNPTSGPYGGFSFVIFPAPDDVCMVAMVVGTQGLSPDEAILGRPGHARKVQAICAWLNKAYGKGQQVAWAKQDPTRVDLDAPDTVKRIWPAYQKVFERYGKVLYAVFAPTQDPAATRAAVTALLDVTFEERGQQPLAQFAVEAEALRASWFDHVMHSSSAEQVTEVLERRRYVILQGPPGTGKTRMARQLLQGAYRSYGRSIQFHANTTYENFVGGLAPVHGDGSLGFRFEPAAGFLMEAAAEAQKKPTVPISGRF
jgi:5-methylcytosine-specific restriction protein B